MSFQSGNPGGALKLAEKPFRDVLWQEIKASGDDHRALRLIAKSLLRLGARGNVAAIKEVADRIDGKVPQGLVADDDGSPIVLQVVRYVVEPQAIDITPVIPITSEVDPVSSDDQSPQASTISKP